MKKLLLIFILLSTSLLAQESSQIIGRWKSIQDSGDAFFFNNLHNY